MLLKHSSVLVDTRSQNSMYRYWQLYEWNTIDINHI